MRTLPVAHLASHASRIVKDVQGGDRVTITVRGEPVAVMVPVAGFVEDATCKRCRFWKAGEVGARLKGLCYSEKAQADGSFYPGPDFGCIHFEEKDK